MKAGKLLLGSGLTLLLSMAVWGKGGATAYGEHASREEMVLASSIYVGDDASLLSLFLALSTAKMGGHHVVKKVLDGHTLLLENNDRVRLIGVESDDVHISGRLCEEASGAQDATNDAQIMQRPVEAFAERMLEGQRVRVVYEHVKSPFMLRERGGDPLVYVFLEDGTFVNAEIIKKGYGRADERFPFKFKDEFERYEREAMEQNRGLWVAWHREEEGHCRN
jgi:micrococcal nuclease